MRIREQQSGGEERLRQAISAAKEAFGVRCHKYVGALTVECVRGGFAEHGIPTSPRDVFIKGVPIEIDIIVPRITAVPEYGICYKPDDVIAAIEVKSYGAFGKHTGEQIRCCFTQIEHCCPSIWCAYVTLMERQSYKYAIDCENLGFAAYTLFWHTDSVKNPQFTPTGQWMQLIDELKKQLQGRA